MEIRWSRLTLNTVNTAISRASLSRGRLYLGIYSSACEMFSWPNSRRPACKSAKNERDRILSGESRCHADGDKWPFRQFFPSGCLRWSEMRGNGDMAVSVSVYGSACPRVECPPVYFSFSGEICADIYAGTSRNHRSSNHKSRKVN